ncbi:unnamed protein product [Chrysoparadoxa australica]
MASWDYEGVQLSQLLGHIQKFAAILASIDTEELHQFTGPQLQNALGWGKYLEKVAAGLAPHQVELLQEHLSAMSESLQPLLKGRDCLGCMAEARRAVLSAVLASPFLHTHAAASKMVVMVVRRYAEVESETGSPALADDVGRVIRQRAMGSCILEVATAWQHMANISSSSGEKGFVQYTSSPGTSQKRAYASLLYDTLQEKHHEGGDAGLEQLMDELEAVVTASTSTEMLEVLGLLMLEHGRRYGKKPSTAPGKSPPWTGAVVKLLLGLGQSKDLWCMDRSLLAEMAECCLPVAEGYLVHLHEVLKPLLEEGLCQGPHGSIGLRKRAEELLQSLEALESKSKRLANLCQALVGDKKRAELTALAFPDLI